LGFKKVFQQRSGFQVSKKSGVCFRDVETKEASSDDEISSLENIRTWLWD
jgi:hypothetical protein